MIRSLPGQKSVGTIVQLGVQVLNGFISGISCAGRLGQLIDDVLVGTGVVS